MKNTNNFLIFICFVFMMINISCEKADIQKSSPNDQGKIEPRTTITDCDQCGVGCCCCGIDLVDGTGGTLSFCGLCEGDYLCGTYNPNSPCSSISGSGSDIILSSGTPHGLFCVPAGGSFRIFNNSTSPMHVRFTCQVNVTDPDNHTITIPAHSEVFFYSDGDCILTGC